MKVFRLLSFFLLSHSILSAQALSRETFGTGSSLPSGWSASTSLGVGTKIEVENSSVSNFGTPFTAMSLT